MPLFEFKCPEHGTFAKLCDDRDIREVECDHADCKQKAKKIISSTHFVMDGKMQTHHPNSPDGVQRAKELREKHAKEGTTKEWAKENKEKSKVDGKFSYE